MPEDPLKRFIKGASALKEKAFIVDDTQFFEGSTDGFRITIDSRIN